MADETESEFVSYHVYQSVIALRFTSGHLFIHDFDLEDTIYSDITSYQGDTQNDA